jgi:hypothetical protein
LVDCWCKSVHKIIVINFNVYSVQQFKRALKITWNFHLDLIDNAYFRH